MIEYTYRSLPELWYSFKAAIIRRLTSSHWYDRMLWEWILIPRGLGCLPSLKVTEFLQILHDGERGWTESAGWSLWIWKSLLFGLPPCPHCPCPPDQLYSADSSLVGNRGEASESSLAKHASKAPTVLILIIDQMIKADEEISFFFLSKSCDCASLTCLESYPKIDTFNHARELFCQSCWVRWLQLSLKTMKNFAGHPQAHSASSQGV